MMNIVNELEQALERVSNANEVVWEEFGVGTDEAIHPADGNKLAQVEEDLKALIASFNEYKANDEEDLTIFEMREIDRRQAETMQAING